MKYCPECGSKWISQNGICSNCNFNIAKILTKKYSYIKGKNIDEKKEKNELIEWILNLPVPGGNFIGIMFLWLIFIFILSFFTKFGNP